MKIVVVTDKMDTDVMNSIYIWSEDIKVVTP